MYKASIIVRLRPSILDPQGKATHHALGELGFASVERVRMGKYIEIWVDEKNEDDARRVATEACARLLANPVMEDFQITLEEAATKTA
jgi:phosphoribosylformylglycinamidine synthase